MKPSLPVVFALLLTSSSALGADGLIAVKSPFAAKETMDRFEANAKKRGLNIFARIDHAAGAAKIGKTLRPTEVLIFGNPQGGTFHGMRTVGWHRPPAESARVARRSRPSLARLQRSRLYCETPRSQPVPSG